jgi:hypothetical protein
MKMHDVINVHSANNVNAATIAANIENSEKAPIPDSGNSKNNEAIKPASRKLIATNT